MTDLEAHVIVTHMSLLLRRKLKDFARTGRITKALEAAHPWRGWTQADRQLITDMHRQTTHLLRRAEQRAIKLNKEPK